MYFFLYNFLATVLSSFPGLREWKITEKTHRRQGDSILFSTKEGGKRNEMKQKIWQKENVTVKKQSNLTQDKLINVARDAMNE